MSYENSVPKQMFTESAQGHQRCLALHLGSSNVSLSRFPGLKHVSQLDEVVLKTEAEFSLWED
jgi:hypothetical protein